jgi:hypothetical protein
LARLREVERLAVLRPELFRPALLRPVLLRPALFRLALLRLLPREDLRVLFRAELPPARLADLPRLADFRPLFLALLPEDFLLLRLAELRLDFFRLPPPDPDRDPDREPLIPPLRLVLAGSSKSKDGDELGLGDGVLSEGSGSIHPEPDQPISI